MPGSSKLAMCRNALLAIGDEFLTSFAVTSKGSTVANNLYASAYAGHLTSVRWRFASAKLALALNVAEPENDFSFAFQMPADLLQLHTTRPITNYEIFGDDIYTNVKPIEIDYTYLVSEALLPDYFILMLEAFLASLFAYPVMSSLGLAKEKRAVYEVLLREAKTADALGRPPDEPVDQPFVQVRA